MVEIIFTIVSRVAGCLAPSAEREINYLLKYKSNFDNLQLGLEKLKNKNTSIQHKVDEAKRNGHKIEEYVQKWLKCVSKIIDDDPVGKFTENEEIAATRRCFIGLCPDLMTRYQLRKEAVKQHDDLVKLLERAESFDRISYRFIPKDPRLSNKDYVPFQSRISTLKNILGALSNPNFNMIGIYGMGGIGKTMLAKEVAKHAEENKLFDWVIFVEVSQHPNIKKIQEEIADSLSLTFSEISESGRAGRLCQRLRDEKKILIILDDIWASLDLKAIGLPVGDDDKGCKLFLTARSVDVLLRKMDSQLNFPVDFLDDEEAWSLFKKMAGDYIEGVEFKSVATDVAKECAGLPISIVTVGRALRAQRLFEWKDALLQLRRPTSRNFKDIQEKAYSAVELSYNLLESEELKKTFLLIGYTYITLVDDLLMYGVGLSLFEDIMKMEEAQDRVCTLVHKLKDSCMLLEDKANVEGFIMHDVVRDVAISIASRDQRIFTMRNQQVNQWEWPNENTPKNYNSIVLIDAEIHELPEVLECPQLKLFSIRARDSSLKVSDSFFKVVTELRVLDLTYMDLCSPPSSLVLLKDLRTLCLYSCKLDNIAVIGALEKLEILFIQRSDIKQLPAEVRQLTRLRSLELRDCFRLKVIPPNVISCLSNLEELRTGTFAEWEVEGNNERRNASLGELKCLPNLTALQICIRDVKTLPRDLLFKKLERYRIFIIRSPWVLKYASEKAPPEIARQFKLELTNTDISLKDGHIMQLRGIEDLCVDGLQDMKNVLYGLDREGFPQLKYLKVKNNPNLLCIVDSMEDVTRNALAFPLLESLSLIDLRNMEKISCGQLAAESFCKLRKINVVNCVKLKNIFSFSIAGRFLQLQSIQVSGCQNMEQIFGIGSEDEFKNNNTGVINIIDFGQLRSLRLYYLPQLTSFCSRSETAGVWSNEIILADEIDAPSTLFNKKVMLPRLEVLELYETKVERIWQSQAVAMSCGIQNLTRLIISSCSNLRCLFSSSIATSFVRLKYLQICQCPALEEMVVDDNKLREEERKSVVFPQLVFLKMEALQNLTKFCSGDYIEFPSLKKLEIQDCPELKGFMVKNIISTDLTEIPLFNEKVAFPSLESLSIEDCGSLEAIFDLEGPNFEDQLSAITHLSELKIVGLPKLKHIWKKDSKKFLCFPNLRLVMVYGCERLKNVFPASVAGSLLQLKSLNISGCGVEEIVFTSEGRAGTNTRFVFPKVTSLELHDLPKFTTFYPEIHTTEWPALKRLVVSGWETVKIFNSEFHGSQEGQQLDIRAQPPQFLVEKVFPNLEELIVKGNGIATVWPFPEHLLRKLKFLQFVFDKSAVFSSLDFLQRFHSIKMLKIGGGIQFESTEEVENGISAWITSLNECSDVKHLLKEETNMDHLVYLQVGACHNLVNLVPSSTSFRNLTTLRLSYCHKLTNIVTSSTAKSLVQLRRMSLSECNMMTEVVADDGDAAKDEIVFSELKNLSLTYLKSLTSFCSGNCAFRFPLLEGLMVYKCPRMNIFSRGVLITPSLLKVKRDWQGKVGHWKGDLNTTIQQLPEETEEPEKVSFVRGGR